ncbi:MAG: 50S ribosomal protein L19 [Candidatus Paceibacterota bacterium]
MTVSANLKISPVNITERAKLDIRPGSTVRVYQKIQEKDKTRLQMFEGMIIARKHGSEPGATFTVRKVASGVGMEKIFPLYSPMIDKIEIVKRTKVRRAKLYYIREKAKKEVRRRIKQLSTEALEKREGQEAEARASGQELAETDLVEKDETVVTNNSTENIAEPTPSEAENKKDEK